MNAELTTGGHQLKLHKTQYELDVRKYVFANKVVDSWNGLSVSIADAVGYGFLASDN